RFAVAVEQHHRSITLASKPLIQTVHFRPDFVAKFTIALDARTAWRGNLHERDRSRRLRPAFEGPLDREQPLLHALGVVHAIDRHDELRVGGQREFRPHFAPARDGVRHGGAPARWPLDGNRIWSHQRRPLLTHDVELLLTYPDFKRAVHALEEVVAVLRRLKADA